MVGTPSVRRCNAKSTTSAVPPEFEINSATSSGPIRPRSPCTASEGCRKLDGKPKLELFYSNDEVYKKVEYDRFGNPVVIDTGEAPEEDPKEAKRKAKEEERKKKKEAKAKKEKEK